MTKIVLALVALVCCLISGPSAYGAVTLFNSGYSRHSIVIGPTAPRSVELAARELQTYVQRSTGATLPVRRFAQPEEGPCICLGDSITAARTNISSSEIPVEGYRIVTREQSIFIIGHDTRDGDVEPSGGISTGTLNGVYAFLEEHFGVRWLMPGLNGDFVPRRSNVVISDIDRTEAPRFEGRTLAYIGNDRPEVIEWLRRQRQGGATKLVHHHNWHALVPKELYDRHPEWFAMVNGERKPPTDDRYKIETTDVELIKYVAAQVASELRRNHSQYSASISPSDGGNWSESQESRMLYDTDPHGGLSLTPLILKFYNDVAARVGQEFPKRVVCGYIYAEYVFPPSSTVLHNEPNICLILAPRFSYGYALYHDRHRTDLTKLLSKWSSATTTLGYYDLPTVWAQNSINAPNAPGLEILEFLYPTLAANRVRTVYIFGSSSWGQGALTNYLLARLNLNPFEDVAALAEEFCKKAYGDKLGALILAAYRKTDAAIAAFRSDHPAYLDQITPDVLSNAYVPVLADWENVRRASSQIYATVPQRTRLGALIADLDVFIGTMAAVHSD